MEDKCETDSKVIQRLEEKYEEMQQHYLNIVAEITESHKKAIYAHKGTISDLKRTVAAQAKRLKLLETKTHQSVGSQIGKGYMQEVRDREAREKEMIKQHEIELSTKMQEQEKKHKKEIEHLTKYYEAELQCYKKMQDLQDWVDDHPKLSMTEFNLRNKIEKLDKELTEAMDMGIKAVRQKELLLEDYDEIQKENETHLKTITAKKEKIVELKYSISVLKQQKREVEICSRDCELESRLLKTNLKDKENQITDLHGEIKEQKATHTKTLKQVKDYELEILQLRETVKRLEKTQTTPGPTLNQLNGEINQLKKKLKEFKEDFLACMDCISDNKTLRMKLMAFKQRHVDNEKGIVIEETTRAEYEKKIAFLSKACLQTRKRVTQLKMQGKKDDEKKNRQYDQLLQKTNTMMEELIVTKRELIRIRDEKETQPVIGKPKKHGAMDWLKRRSHKIAPDLTPVNI